MIPKIYPCLVAVAFLFGMTLGGCAHQQPVSTLTVKKASGGNCNPTCVAPYICCGDNQCHNPQTDNNNCGACGNKCMGAATCASGVCALGCDSVPPPLPTSPCNGSNILCVWQVCHPSNGNCGAVSAVCRAPDNGSCSAPWDCCHNYTDTDIKGTMSNMGNDCCGNCR